MKKKKTLIWLATALVLLGALASTVYIVSPFLLPYVNADARGKRANRLVNSGELIGLTLDEAKKKLKMGTPERLLKAPVHYYFLVSEDFSMYTVYVDLSLKDGLVQSAEIYTEF